MTEKAIKEFQNNMYRFKSGCYTIERVQKAQVSLDKLAGYAESERSQEYKDVRSTLYHIEDSVNEDLSELVWDILHALSYLSYEDFLDIHTKIKEAYNHQKEIAA